MGLNQKIYARKCEKIILEVQDKNKFLNGNQMLGEDKSNRVLEEPGLHPGHAKLTREAFTWTSNCNTADHQFVPPGHKFMQIIYYL